MSITAQKVCIEALSLPRETRAEIAERLLHSLEETLGSPEIEATWIQEAHRRYKGFKAGKIKARASSEVMRDAYRKVK